MSIVERAREEIRSLNPYQSARREAANGGVLLNANENPYPAPGCPEPPANRYPAPQPAALVERMARLYRVDPNRVLVTRGSDEAIDLVVRAFCRAYRDAVVCCPPTFGMYRIAADTQAARTIEVPLRAADGFALDVDGIRRALDDEAVRVIFLCSPNNPTGNCMDRQDLLEVAEAARDRALVVVDEAYLEFSGAASIAEQIASHDNLAVLRTLSKAYALAGARCGALIADPAVIRLLSRIMAPYPVAEPVARAAVQALDPDCAAAVEAQLDAICYQRDRLLEKLDGLEFVDAVHPSDANFALVRVADSGALLRAAAERGIVLRDMSRQPGLANCVRITAGSPGEMSRLFEFLDAFDG